MSDAVFLAWWGRMPLAQAERIVQDRPTESRTRQIAAALGAAYTVQHALRLHPNALGAYGLSPPPADGFGGGCADPCGGGC